MLILAYIVGIVCWYVMENKDITTIGYGMGKV